MKMVITEDQFKRLSKQVIKLQEQKNKLTLSNLLIVNEKK